MPSLDKRNVLSVGEGLDSLFSDKKTSRLSLPMYDGERGRDDGEPMLL